MAEAGYLKKVFEGTGVNELPTSNATLEHSGDVLDVTEMRNNAGWRQRILGIRDFSMSLDGPYDAGDTGLTNLRTAWLNRTQVIIDYLPDGVSGFRCPCVVESFNLSGDVNSIESFECSLQADGVITTI